MVSIHHRQATSLAPQAHSARPAVSNVPSWHAPASVGQPPTARRLRARSAAGGLLWGLSIFLGIQLALSIGMDTGHPEWRDPEFGNRLARLQQLRQEQVDRP